MCRPDEVGAGREKRRERRREREREGEREAVVTSSEEGLIESMEPV